MSERAPEVSVVLATHNRPEGLAAMLESLRAQSLPPESFEVIVVDDCSTDHTPSLLDRERLRGGLDLHVLRREQNGGPAQARNDGWRGARAPVVAFTDDDCVAGTSWLTDGLRVCAEHPGAVVQGRTDPMPGGPDGWRRLFSHTLRICEAGPYYETCNIFYPRTLLERVGGFDAEAFPEPVPGGEDTDLGWRAISDGAATAFAEGAQVFHAVTWLGPLGKLRLAARWSQTIQAYARHPGLRKTLTGGVFWKGSHYLLVRAIIALALPPRLWPIRRWLGNAYIVYMLVRVREEGVGPLAAPYLVLHDLIEVGAVVRGAWRYRTFII